LSIRLPDGHPDDSYVDEDTQIDYLKAKVDAGADFIVTQLFYDADQFFVMVQETESERYLFLPSRSISNLTVRKE